MSYSPTRKLINTAEYYRMGEVGILTEKDRVELIHGEIIEMSPIGSQHSSVVNRISNILKEYLGKKAIVSTQNPVISAIRTTALHHYCKACRRLLRTATPGA